VLTVDLRGYGETRDSGSSGKYFNHEQYTGYLAMHIGRPLLGQRVEDVLAAVDALTAVNRVDSEDVELIGIRTAGPIAMHAAVLDPRITSVRTEESIQSWIDDVVARPLERDLMGYVVPDVLSLYDLPDLVELLKKR
jgi:cephalosporin-C deacetylase-like acetyl esterase